MASRSELMVASEMLETMVRAHGGAWVLSMLAEIFDGLASDDDDEQSAARWRNACENVGRIVPGLYRKAGE